MVRVWRDVGKSDEYYVVVVSALTVAKVANCI